MKKKSLLIPLALLLVASLVACAAPAQRLGLASRGLIKEGLAADLVVFAPETIKDTATFDEPKKHPVGIGYVLVNCAMVVEKGKHTGILPGEPLTKANQARDKRGFI